MHPPVTRNNLCMWSQKLEYFGHKTEAAVQGLAQRVFSSAKAGLLVKLDERSCLGGSVTKKYKSSNYGNVTGEVRRARDCRAVAVT